MSKVNQNSRGDNSQRSNVKNPNNNDYKLNNDNRSVQLNNTKATSKKGK